MEKDKKEYVLLSLGSNIGDKKKYINDACDLIKERNILQNITKSSYYRTEPYGVKQQDNFINIVVSGFTELSAFELLAACKVIELDLGRQARERWHEREIDIDILIYGNEVVLSDKLIVPHPLMKQRKFVLIPATEIAAKAKDPLSCKTISELLKECEDESEVHKLN